MKVEYNKRVYRIGNGYCAKCALVNDKCLGDIGQCFLYLDEILIYSDYSLLFEL